jgi:hypothetical protein
LHGKEEHDDSWDKKAEARKVEVFDFLSNRERGVRVVLWMEKQAKNYKGDSSEWEINVET